MCKRCIFKSVVDKPRRPQTEIWRKINQFCYPKGLFFGDLLKEKEIKPSLDINNAV